MALNNRIYKYTCDVCARSVERLADPTRPDPLRCVITDQCTGKLSLTASRFGLRPINTPPVIGLLDRIKRGSSRAFVPQALPLDKTNITSFNGTNGLTLGILFPVDGVDRAYCVYDIDGNQRVLARSTLDVALPSNVTITAMLFELTPAALEYKRYTYARTERCVDVQGKDNSASQAVLSFDETSNLRIFVNGVLLPSDKYDKTVDGIITFTPELEQPSLLIEIFVYKSLTQFFNVEDALRLEFTSLSVVAPERSGCAWGDVARVESYVPIYCSDMSTLDDSRTYGLVKLEAVDEDSSTFTVDPRGIFLLANPPYAFQDKKLTAVVPVTVFTNEGFPLGFSINGETGETNAVVDGETLMPLARPLVIQRLSSQTSSQAAETVSLLVVKNERSFILGPT